MKIIVWILAYTLCLINLGLLLYRYKQTKEPGIFKLMILVSNMVLTAVLIMVLLLIHVTARVFELTLGNFLLTFFISVPYFAYEAAGVPVKRWFVTGTFAISAILLNLLLLTGRAPIAFDLIWTPFVPEMAPLFLPPFAGQSTAGTASSADFRRTLAVVGILVGGLAILLLLFYMLLAHTALGHRSLFVDTYFAFFTIVYQLPILWFALRLKGMRPPDGEREGEKELAGLSRLQLTPREREVAAKLYEGLTYGEIAESMYVSLSAVKKHAYNIYRKNQVQNSRQLIRKIIQSAE